MLTSSTSTVPYQQEEISAFLSIVDKVKGVYNASKILQFLINSEFNLVDNSDESGHGFWAIGMEHSRMHKSIADVYSARPMFALSTSQFCALNLYWA